MNEEPECLSSATLMIFGDDLVPGEITNRLKIEPDQAWRRGDRKYQVKQSDGGKSLVESYEWGGWKSFIPDEKKDLELHEQLAYWSDRLAGCESVMRELESEGLELQPSCFVSTSATASMIISAELQRRLSRLRLDLCFSFFVDDLTLRDAAEQAPGANSPVSDF